MSKLGKFFTFFFISMLAGCSAVSEIAGQRSNKTKPVAIPAANNSSPATPSVVEKNLLSLANGAFLVRHPASFGFWSMMIIDGSDNFWISPGGRGTRHEFIIGLPAVTTFRSFAFKAGDDYYGPGSSAREIQIEVSENDYKSGWKTVLETSLPIDVSPATKFPATAQLPARFVRLTVKSSHKNPENVSLAEFLGYGEQRDESIPASVSGAWRATSHFDEGDESNAATNGFYRELMGDERTGDDGLDYIVRQDGTQVFGCIRNNENESFQGGLSGNVAPITWRNNENQAAQRGVFTFAPDGKRLYYTVLGDNLAAVEYKVFEKISETTTTCGNEPKTAAKADASTGIARDLETSGRSVLYGINFDFNSDKLRPESITVLDRVITILKTNPDWKMTIEGHTDNIGGEAFNKTLSEKRAAAVVAHLVRGGIDAGRLTAFGAGLSRPIADNATELGRAANRRVELVKR